MGADLCVESEFFYGVPTPERGVRLVLCQKYAPKFRPPSRREGEDGEREAERRDRGRFPKTICRRRWFRR